MTAIQSLAAESIPTNPFRDPSQASSAKSSRLVSLDIFRGLTVAAMLLVNNPGKGESYPSLEHAPWHGWTPTDLIFPFFLFMVGVAIPFSLAGGNKQRFGGGSGATIGTIWLRALSLFMLGQLLAGFPTISTKPLPDGYELLKALRAIAFVFICMAIVALLIRWPWRQVRIAVPIVTAIVFYGLAIALHYVNESATAGGWPASLGFGTGIFNPDRMRIPGVLQRIGICYGVAASIAAIAGWRSILAIFIVLCSVYSALMLAGTWPDHTTGSLTQTDNFARSIDVAVLDRYETAPNGKKIILQQHSYAKYPDNEGILSTLPAIGTSLLGILAGLWLRSTRPAADRCSALLSAGVLVTILGWCLDGWLMPINKNLWTPSFTVFTAGLAMLGLGAVYWLADVRGYKGWGWPLSAFGMNAIVAFVLAGLIPRIGRMIRIVETPGKEPIGVLNYVDHRIAEQVKIASDAIQQFSPKLPILDTPQNTSLAYAICFVLAILIPLAALKLCRVYVKV